MLAVQWYLRFGVSYRDVEELLAERGIDVDHVTIFRWVQRFTPELIDAARPCRHAVGGSWFVDETYARVAGIWRYVYRAVDPSRTRRRNRPPHHTRPIHNQASQPAAVVAQPLGAVAEAPENAGPHRVGTQQFMRTAVSGCTGSARRTRPSGQRESYD